MSSATAFEEKISVTWPRFVAGKPHRAGLARLSLMLASTLLAADPLLNSYILPNASQELGMDTSQTALAASISTILMVATLLAVGVAGDRSGRRRMLLIGLICMFVGVSTCTLALTGPMYLTGRCIVGIGIASVYAMSLSMIPTVTSRENLAKAYGYMFALWGVVTLIAAGVGSTLLKMFGWRVANLTDVAIILIFLLLAFLTVPESRSSVRRPFDVIGTVLAAVALVTFIVALGRIADQNGLDLISITELVVSVVAGASFFLVEAKSPKAAFPLALLTVPMVAAACIAVFAVNMALGSAQIEVTRTLLTTLHANPTIVLIATLPIVVGQVIGSLGIARLIRNGRHTGIAVVSSLIMVGLGMAVAATLSSAQQLAGVILGMLLVGTGSMAVITVASVVIMSNAPPDRLASVGVLKPMAAQLGYAIGLGAVIPIATLFANSQTSDSATQAGLAGYSFSMIFVSVSIVLLVAIIGFMLWRHSRDQRANLGQISGERPLGQ